VDRTGRDPQGDRQRDQDTHPRVTPRVGATSSANPSLVGVLFPAACLRTGTKSGTDIVPTPRMVGKQKLGPNRDDSSPTGFIRKHSPALRHVALRDVRSPVRDGKNCVCNTRVLVFISRERLARKRRRTFDGVGAPWSSVPSHAAGGVATTAQRCHRTNETGQKRSAAGNCLFLRLGRRRLGGYNHRDH